MKNSNILLILLLVTYTGLGQVTKEPYVSSTNVDNVIIESVTVDKKSTDVFLTYWKTKSDLYQAWVAFSSNTYLVDKDTGQRYKILSLNNAQGSLQLDQRYATTGKKGKVRGKKGTVYLFNLKFPSLPPGVENIDVLEELNGEYGFVWRGIHINNPDLSKSTYLNASLIKNDWLTNGIDANEGIYEDTGSANSFSKYKLAVKKTDEGYSLIYLSGADNDKWEEGDVKAFLTPTATSNIFRTTWYMANKSINENVYITFEKGAMKVIWSDSNEESLYLKLFPTGSATDVSNSPSSGTGFAISENGYVATNYHVIENANLIKIRGVKGDFSKIYNAEVIGRDKNNDLAILKIKDDKFTSLGRIPYKFSNEFSQVGYSVFSLGYPLRATMGDEVKLTNGIISSNTGFQGDITTYQTSVPVQPGNSGGPLFDSEGNIVGIINAKHSNADNASYAIKVNYLDNLLAALNLDSELQTNNFLSGMDLAEQTKFIKEFVFIIETN